MLLAPPRVKALSPSPFTATAGASAFSTRGSDRTFNEVVVGRRNDTGVNAWAHCADAAKTDRRAKYLRLEEWVGAVLRACIVVSKVNEKDRANAMETIRILLSCCLWNEEL